MKKKEPRNYQKDIIEQAINSNKSTLIQIPTGGGKTFIAYEIATDLIAKFNQQVLFIAPKENLMNQTAREFKFARPHIVHSSNRNDKNIKTYDFKTYPLLISTLQTAYRRDNINPDVIIIDETHFGFDGKMINTLMKNNKHSRIIGLSATPYDKYGRQLQGFDLILDKYDMNYMIENKYLVPLKSYKRQKINLEKVRVTKYGDYDETQLEGVVCDSHTIMEIVETTKEKVEESLKTIVFAVTIKHADLLAEAYKKAGFTARSLHSKSLEKDIETIDYFRKGYIKVLVSVSKLTTGFDVPETDCAVIARPTKSQNLYKQMVGRILRLSPETNKTHAVLLDCGNVIDELGDPLAPIKLVQPKESDNTLKCNQCQSENLKLKKIDNKSFWECQECGHLKKIKEGTYKCSNCNRYSNKNSKFIFTKNKIMLDCSYCGAKTTISEFLDNEELVCVSDVENTEQYFEKKFTGNHICFPPSVYKKISTYMRENDYHKISKYIYELMKEYNTDFNTVWYQLDMTWDEEEQLQFHDHPIEYLLPEANKSKDYTSIKYILENNEELKYSILDKAVKNNLLYLEKFLMANYKFILEDLFFELTQEDYMDFSYELFESDILKSFFKKYAYLWESFDAYLYIRDFLEDEEKDELEKTLMSFDYFFKQYNITVYVQNNQNSYKYLSYSDAKEFVHKLKLTSIQEWNDYVLNNLSGNKKPNVIPDYPSIVYGDEWTTMSDWLNCKPFDILLEELNELRENDVGKFKNLMCELLSNINFKDLSTEQINEYFHRENLYNEFNYSLLSNTTIPLEVKIKFILTDESNNKKSKISNLIRYLDIDSSETVLAKKLVVKFEQVINTLKYKNALPYTPNIKNASDSFQIIRQLRKKLKKVIQTKIVSN